MLIMIEVDYEKFLFYLAIEEQALYVYTSMCENCHLRSEGKELVLLIEQSLIFLCKITARETQACELG